MNENCRDETPLTEAQLETGFADVWQGLRALPAEQPSAAFVANLRTALHSALAQSAPVLKFPAPRSRLAAKLSWAVGLAAALALATWLGLREPSSEPAPVQPVEIAKPETVTPAAQPELASENSLPHEPVVDGFVETAAQLARLEREIGEMPEAPVAAATLAEQFPYFEKTFEETLGGS